jgi:hypothetical protein
MSVACFPAQNCEKPVVAASARAGDFAGAGAVSAGIGRKNAKRFATAVGPQRRIGRIYNNDA